MKRGWRGLVAAGFALFAAVFVPTALAEGPCILPPGKENGEHRTVVLPGGAKLSLAWIGKCTVEIGKEGQVAWAREADNESGGGAGKAVRTPLDGFWIGVCEVTQRQWKSVMGDNPSYFRGEELPVECVSWEDCMEFCRRTGLRLPRETEWLLANSSSWRYATRSWTAGNSGGRTHPVARSNAGPAGLYDLNGNVCEWCADWFAPWPVAPAANCEGPADGTERVVCGGSWCGDEWFDARLRKERLSLPPDSRYNNVGFRVCLSPSQDE